MEDIQSNFVGILKNAGNGPAKRPKARTSKSAGGGASRKKEPEYMTLGANRQQREAEGQSQLNRMQSVLRTFGVGGGTDTEPEVEAPAKARRKAAAPRSTSAQSRSRSTASQPKRTKEEELQLISSYRVQYAIYEKMCETADLKVSLRKVSDKASLAEYENAINAVQIQLDIMANAPFMTDVLVGIITVLSGISPDLNNLPQKTIYAKNRFKEYQAILWELFAKHHRYLCRGPEFRLIAMMMRDMGEAMQEHQQATAQKVPQGAPLQPPVPQPTGNRRQDLIDATLFGDI